jgi:hypothetical protein
MAPGRSGCCIRECIDGRPPTHRLPDRRAHRSPVRAGRAGPHRRHQRLHRAAAAGAQEKPKVSAFTSAKIGEILKLKPDFVIGFSDIQADIAAELVRHGVEVWISNHRSVPGILDYIRRLGALVGAAARADAYADGLRRGLDAIVREAAALPRRPKVYFEEWDEPPITGIRWVAELVRIAGGDDIFPERALEPLAKAPHPGGCRRGGTPRAGHHPGLVVRQEIPSRESRRAPRLGCHPGGARRRTARRSSRR